MTMWGNTVNDDGEKANKEKRKYEVRCEEKCQETKG